MRTLDRYLLREILLPFAIGLGLFCVVVAFAQILKISDSVTGLGVTGPEMLQAVTYSLPPLLGLLIPVSALFATLLAIGRLAADRELVGLAAGTISPFRLLWVPSGVGAVLGICSAVALGKGEPWGIKGLRDLMARSAQQALATGVRAGEFQEWIPGVVLLAQHKDEDVLQEVFFADRRSQARPLVLVADRGVLRGGAKAKDLVFELKDGDILLSEADSSAYRVLNFETMFYRLDVGGLVSNKARTLSPVQEKDIGELWRGSRDPALPTNSRAQHTIALHRKLAFPTATLIFALLAVPLACSRKPGARARGFLYSAGIVAGYYYLGRAVELSARAGNFDPVLAAWLPNLVGLAALGIMLWRFRWSAV